MILKAKIWKFGKNVDTDELFAGRHLMAGNVFDKADYKKEISKRGMSDVNFTNNVPKGFLEKVRPGDIIVARENFGIGSSRQQAAETLRFRGITAIVADSIHRIFFRNFWNLGGAAIDLPGISRHFKGGQKISIDFNHQRITNISTGREFRYSLKIPDWFLEMFKAGGLVEYVKAKKV
jgi:3-isopropylmalate/(R)-2-methylmalate dehydratase small subunit